MAAEELVRLTAREAVRRLKRREIAPAELIEAALARIAEVEPAVNALPTLCADRARAAAAKVSPDSLLAGLPLAIKDLTDVAGVRSTQGSPIFADHVPARSDLMVERIEAHGGVVLGKSNTPEFGAGANTFNAVFGETRNPWNTALTCAGSSGGSAAALAAGEVWLATGSDLGGSLRTPASFCGVVGIRPSPGRVASGPSELPFGTLAVEGPMGRNVGDAALLLDAMVGEHPEDPLALPAPAASFRAQAERPRLPRRVAFSADLGICPMDPEVVRVARAAVERLAREGVEVVETCPDFSEAPAAFKTLRALGFVASLEEAYERHRDKLKPDVIWNIEHGLSLDATAVGRAERARGRLFQRMAKFFEVHELLICPAAQVPPFPVETRWIKEIAGRPLDNYVEWIRITYAITLTSSPVVALPCGFTADGRPVGLQLVGRPRGEAPLIAAAAALEAIFGLADRVPLDPSPGR
jgi:amidase